MGVCVYVYDEHRLPVAEISLSNGGLRCVSKNESRVSACLKQFVEELSETGIAGRGCDVQGDSTYETEVPVDLESPDFVSALRDCINANTFAGCRVAATNRRFEAREEDSIGVNRLRTSSVADEFYMAIMRPVADGGVAGEMLIDIPNCRLPTAVRYATICGENFNR